MKKESHLRRVALFIALGLAGAVLPSCVPLAVGAASGEAMPGEGYRARNPIKIAE